MKEKLQFIIISFFMWLLFSTINVLANSYQYNSSDVLYDNSNTDIESTDVQGAVGELYRTATDYSTLNGRVTNLEGYFQNNPTSFFYGNGIRVGYNVTGTNGSFATFYDSTKTVRGALQYKGSGKMVLDSRDSSGSEGTGILDIKAETINIGTSSSTVKINGTDLTTITTGVGTSVNREYFEFDLNYSKIGHIVVFFGQGYMNLAKIPTQTTLFPVFSGMPKSIRNGPMTIQSNSSQAPDTATFMIAADNTNIVLSRTHSTSTARVYVFVTGMYFCE